MILVRLLRAAIPFGLLWIPKLILDDLLQSLHGNKPITATFHLLLAELALAISADLLSRANNVLDVLLGDRFTDHVALLLMDKSTFLDLSSFEDPVYYDKLARIRSQSANRMWLLVSVLNSTQELITLSVLSAAFILFSPWLLLLLVASAVPTFGCEVFFSKLNYSALSRQTPKRRLLEYYRYLLTCAETAKEIRLFGLKDHFKNRYLHLSAALFDENRSLAIKRAVGGWTLSLLSAAAYYLGYLDIIHALLSSVISVGTFTFLIGSFSRARSSTERIFSSVNDICEQAHFVRDLIDFLQIQPTISSPIHPISLTKASDRGFEFRHVSFIYPGSSSYVLTDVSFRIEPSEIVAIVGRNGAGKTTITRLICRLYEPSSGQIFLDGIEIRDYDILDYRKQISALFQDYVRFDLSIRENIGFGEIDFIGDDNRIRNSARLSGASQLLERFPLGLNQLLGRQFEGAADLSGGEWQKIALARAYTRDARLLILDEPTASIDVEAEYKISRNFREITSDRMAIIISHRFSSLRMANKILVIEAGIISEEGTHEELIYRAGLYSELYRIQSDLS